MVDGGFRMVDLGWWMEKGEGRREKEEGDGEGRGDGGAFAESKDYGVFWAWGVSGMVWEDGRYDSDRLCSYICGNMHIVHKLISFCIQVIVHPASHIHPCPLPFPPCPGRSNSYGSRSQILCICK